MYGLATVFNIYIKLKLKRNYRLKQSAKFIFNTLNLMLLWHWYKDKVTKNVMNIMHNLTSIKAEAAMKIITLMFVSWPNGRPNMIITEIHFSFFVYESKTNQNKNSSKKKKVKNLQNNVKLS